MNSVQHIIEDVIGQVVEIVSKNNNGGIKRIARQLQTTINEAVLKTLAQMLREADRELYCDKELRKNWGLVRKNDTKKIMICVGKLEYVRRY